VSVARRSGLIKAAVGVAALGMVGVLFVRSARSVRAEPFKVAPDHLARWTLSIEPTSSPSGVLLGLRPSRELAAALFNEVFARSGESLSGPVPPAIPLILQSELDARAAATLGPEALLALARAAGFESATLEPRCMAQRRVSAPGITRQVYFVVFGFPMFDEFRRQVSQRLRDSGHASPFEPAAQSPVLIVAATDAAFSRWLPLKADADKECFAPIDVGAGK
jgi:hypothetical protein